MKQKTYERDSTIDLTAKKNHKSEDTSTKVFQSEISKGKYIKLIDPQRSVGHN